MGTVLLCPSPCLCKCKQGDRYERTVPLFYEEEVPYDYYILNVTLDNKGLANILLQQDSRMNK